MEDERLHDGWKACVGRGSLCLAALCWTSCPLFQNVLIAVSVVGQYKRQTGETMTTGNCIRPGGHGGHRDWIHLLNALHIFLVCIYEARSGVAIVSWEKVTHPGSCVRRGPGGTRRSTCTCSFLGCWCTRGHNLHCIRSHIRLHLQGKDARGCEGELSFETDSAKKRIYLFSSRGQQKKKSISIAGKETFTSQGFFICVT